VILMTLQIPATRHDELAFRLATRIEQRLTVLADELEHAGIVVYEGDRGFATRGGIIRMSVADLAAVVAEVVIDGSAAGAALAAGPDTYA
jgi:hypothetical protein